jgi:hypothetical protein
MEKPKATVIYVMGEQCFAEPRPATRLAWSGPSPSRGSMLAPGSVALAAHAELLARAEKIDYGEALRRARGYRRVLRGGTRND